MAIVGYDISSGADFNDSLIVISNRNGEPMYQGDVDGFTEWIMALYNAAQNAIDYMERTSSDCDTYHKEMMETLRSALKPIELKIEHCELCEYIGNDLIRRNSYCICKRCAERCYEESTR